METADWPLAVFYDGSCRVCSTEIKQYRILNHQERLLFVDISSPEFEAVWSGPSYEELQSRMHVRDNAGHDWSGVRGLQGSRRKAVMPLQAGSSL